MRYAFQKDDTTYVTGADSIEEFEILIADIDAADGTALNMEGIIEADQAGMMEMLTDEVFEGMTKAPLVIKHTTNAELRSAFLFKHKIEVVKRNAAIKRQADMLAFLEEDEYSPDADSRTIEEIHGLVDEDRWDKRTEEEIVADDEKKKLWDAAKKAGDLSGDSFGPNPNRKKKEGEPTASVTDVKTSIGPDGRIQIDRVLGVKGLHDQPTPAQQKVTGSQRSLADILGEAAGGQQGLVDEVKAQAEADEDNEDLSVDPEGMVAIFYKVEVHGKKLADLRALAASVNFDLDLAVVQRNNRDGFWVAFARQLQAEEIEAHFRAAGWVVGEEAYGVNDLGERLVPKGVQMVDVGHEKAAQPRPWNDQKNKLDAMSDAEKEENWKHVAPVEFVFCGNYEGADQGTIIYIAPKSYFTAKGEMFPDSLNIDAILPRDFSEVSPGVYRSKSRDWNHISFDMASRGFRENLSLQIHLNSL